MNNLDVLNGLEESKRASLFHLAGVIAEPLTRRILAKLNSPHSPIAIDAIPITELRGGKPQIISRLIKLEQLGLVRSDKIRAENGYCKKYFINSETKDLVSMLTKEESKFFE